MKCVVVSIGDELLIGQVNNTNATWLCSTLTVAGVDVVGTVVIPDKPEALRGVFAQYAGQADLFVCTGGLGPTEDDRTKDVLAQYFGMPLQMHNAALANIERLFNANKRPLQENNRLQAMLPAGARIFINPYGTASGMWFEKDGMICIALPGVPFEMKALMAQILPELQKAAHLKPRPTMTLYTAGIAESVLATRLTDWETKLRNDGLELAYLPGTHGVRLRITAPNGDEERIDKYIDALRDIVPKYLVATDGSALPVQVGKLLLSKKATVCTAESCTGGFMAHLITSVPGSSEWFRGSVVAYSNDLKVDILGVDAAKIKRYGAVSEAVVSKMAYGARLRCGADYAVATSGIAGPGGGTEEKPVGTIWMAVAGPEGLMAKCLHLNDNRERNIERAAFAALNILRLMIIDC